jgi:hypothetical protein
MASTLVDAVTDTERLGAVYADTLTMPDDYPYAQYYAAEARTKRRYRWDLPQEPPWP